VIVAARGALPMTASGKLQRNEVRARLVRGELA
jgi:acyl-coenzyme A synthetase/AMP-(fatty) acid ligase